MVNIFQVDFNLSSKFKGYRKCSRIISAVIWPYTRICGSADIIHVQGSHLLMRTVSTSVNLHTSTYIFFQLVGHWHAHLTIRLMK